MLKPNGGSQPVGATLSRQSAQSMRALRDDMQGADDEKLRQIITLLDGSSDTQVWQTLLDPLRPRLTVLKPVRALRFTRLLFIPAEGLIVPAKEWRPGQPTIPRTVLKSISQTVRAGLGAEADSIEQSITPHKTDEAEVVTRAGLALWGHAGEILARAPPPINWEDTGLRQAVYAPLAKAIASVLRRASALRELERDAEVGVLKLDERALGEIIANMAGEPAEGRAMIFKVVLRRLPHATSLLRSLVGSGCTPADRILLQKAMDQGTDDLLSAMENGPEVTGALRDVVLSDVGAEVQRIAALLDDIDNDPSAARHRPRLKGLQKKLDSVCRSHFVDGMTKGLVEPLAGTGAPANAAASQRQMETCARDLRTIETAGRKVGSPSTYDTLLVTASESVAAAAGCGHIGTMHAVRLVEILSGPEAAEAMYKKATAGASGAR